MSELSRILIEDFKDKEFAHAYAEEFLNTSIATQIKILREQRGWTQSDLATKSGMKQSRISLLENINYDRWSITTLKKLANAFDLALAVSFESFTDRIRDIERFNRDTLERKSRMDDITSNALIMQECNVSSSDLKLDFMIDLSANWELSGSTTLHSADSDGDIGDVLYQAAA